jgi:hypothetical protein
MGHREVRPVAIGWEHPREPGTHSDGSPRYRPLFSRADLLSHTRDREEHPEDYDDGKEGEIDLDDYMPPIPEGADFGYVLYETTTEGTPDSPVFETLEELATWCEDNATVFADIKWTRAEWLASFRAGTTDTDSTPLFVKR